MNQEQVSGAPVLYARGADESRARLTAVLVAAEGEAPPPLVPQGSEPVPATLLARLYGHCVWAYDFALPALAPASYRLGASSYEVHTRTAGDVRIAFVSCNGQENGDDGRDQQNRNVMWRRLLEEHRDRPFALLLHGGDQLYADEAVEAHPEIERWDRLPAKDRFSVAFTGEMREAIRRYFFFRYLALMRQPATAELSACVPSLMIWDDHDIFDGWGSHAPEVQESPVGAGIFKVAREMFVLFQLGASLDRLPPTCLDRSGTSFTTAVQYPGFSVLLPDLRSERRPTQVMGEAGWAALEKALALAPDGDRRILVSSVPALGPRLSLVESVLDFLPRAQRYEDDLRDQWQSRGHRGEWARFLGTLERQTLEHRAPVTLLSGEIHLATRGEMRLPDGSTMHQLVASGIAHPRPARAYSIGLGLLSRLGESPLPGRPIRIRPLPGRRIVYTAERNYLVLSRRSDDWLAEWELEDTGRTPELLI